MAGEKEERAKDYSWVNLKKDAKIEDFDFYEFTGDLTNSITDQLYRSYFPPLEKRYRDEQANYSDDNHANDLDVSDIVEEIRTSIKDEVVKSAANSVKFEVIKQLEEQYHPKRGSPEDLTDKAVKNVRWLMVGAFLPVYFVVAALILVVWIECFELIVQSWKYASVIFGENFGSGETIRSATAMVGRTELNAVVATILSILDLLLLGSLIIMVLVGGYENTVARVGMAHNVPTWFGKLDIGQLKLKVAASIVIISSIHLLMSFMQVEITQPVENPDSLMWTAIIHGVFVLSALTLAFMEKINKSAETEHHKIFRRPENKPG